MGPKSQSKYLGSTARDAFDFVTFHPVDVRACLELLPAAYGYSLVCA